jgi:glycosyltransferase (activator-dependent family)
MRVLFVTLPTKAHAYAQVPMAWALRSAGHEVCVATNPELVDEVSRTGLPAVAVGHALDQAGLVEQNREREEALAEQASDAPDPMELLRLEEVSDDSGPEHLQGLLTVMANLVLRTFSPDDMVDDLVRLARGWKPDLVVWDTLVLAGAVAAKAAGAAHARLLYGLDLLGFAYSRYRRTLAALPPEVHDDPLQEWLQWTLARYGQEFSDDVVLGQWTVDPVSSSMRMPVEHLYLPVRYVPYNGPAVVPGWLREPPKRRRVCLTLGLSFREVMGGDRASVGDLLEAVADLDVEVVATLDARQLGGVRTVPGNVRTVDFVALDQLLPSCAAIIHQGGFGQMQTAVVHGVPQIILPNQEWDTVPRARLITEAGAGLCVPDPAACTPAGLRRMLVEVLDRPSYAAAAAALQAELIATPAPAELVPTMERLAAEHRQPR